MSLEMNVKHIIKKYVPALLIRKSEHFVKAKKTNLLEAKLAKYSASSVISEQHYDTYLSVALYLYQQALIDNSFDKMMDSVRAFEKIELIAIKKFQSQVIYAYLKSLINVGQFDIARYKLESYRLLNWYDENFVKIAFILRHDLYITEFNDKSERSFNVIPKLKVDEIQEGTSALINKEVLNIPSYQYVKNGNIYWVKGEEKSKTISNKLFFLSNVIVDKENNIFSEGRFVEYETGVNLSKEFVSGLWHRFYGSNFRLDAALELPQNEKIKAVHLDEAAHVFGRVGNNIFHILLEYLPRVMLIEKVHAFDKLNVIVPENLPIQFFELAQIILGSRYKFITHRKGTVFYVNKLIVPSMYMELDDTHNAPMLDCGYYSNNALQFLKQKVDKNVPRTQFHYKKVYLCREGGLARGVANEPKVRRFLKRQGFSIVDPGKLTIQQQVNLFRCADVIAGTAGAAFVWSFLCKPSTTLISFVAEGNEEYAIQPKLADFGGARHLFISGQRPRARNTYTTKQEYFHSDFSIRIGDLKKSLDAIN